MNNIIHGRTNPNVRHLLKGILLCEMLNQHLARKKTSDMIRKIAYDNSIEFLYDIIIISDDEEMPLLKKNKNNPIE